MSKTRATAVVRHTLKFEGAPHDDAGNRIVLGRWAGVGGVGRGRCSCGDLSQDLTSSLMRREWHRRHKHLKRVETFLTSYVEGQEWPFTEDDRANVTGFGHQDPVQFARDLTMYDIAMMGEENWNEGDAWSEKDVIHRWAVFEFVDDDLANVTSKGVSPDTHPECVAITTVWGQR